MGHTSTSLAAGFAITASPGPGGPSRQAARPVIPLTAQPDNGGAGQMQRHRQVPSGARRRRARPRSGETADRGDPA
jgi:type IV secretory pathway TrbL component